MSPEGRCLLPRGQSDCSKAPQNASKKMTLCMIRYCLNFSVFESPNICALSDLWHMRIFWFITLANTHFGASNVRHVSGYI